MADSLNQSQKDKKTKVAEVVRFGEKISIPTGMTLEDAMRNIEAKMKEEEQVVTLNEDFDIFLWEGVYALAATLDDRYGWFQQVSTPGFFGKTPPALISVDIDLDKTVQVPWGRFLVPGIPAEDGYFTTGYQTQENGFITFRLGAQLKKKHSDQFHSLCAAVRLQLKKHSLYKGKSITIAFRNPDGNKVEMPTPKFQRVSKVAPDGIIFSKHVENAIVANLFTPITESQECRDAGIPLKRGVLLAGPYGTGKTLVATATAELCRDHGWTYLYCQNPTDFPDVVKFAQRYQPAVVFCEDIDKVTKDRTTDMDVILNTIDGVDSKGTDLILVLTTNEVDKIHPSFLRPGRLDAVISVERPDGEAVGRLIRYYAGGLMPEEETLVQIGEMIKGNTPAVIREVVERSKLAAISLGENAKNMKLSEKALIISANTMKMQLDLLNAENRTPATAMETLGNVVGHHLTQGIIKAANEVMKKSPDAGRIVEELYPETLALSSNNHSS